MTKKIFTCLFIFILISCTSYAFSLRQDVTLQPNLFLSGIYAGGNLTGFSPVQPYKSTLMQLDLPVYILIADNIYADINYFVRTDYNKSISANNDFTYNFQKANINYKTDALSLKLGRQDYIRDEKKFFIYYGSFNNKDNRLPTALDGINHSANLDFISYDILAAREVKKLSIYKNSSLIYGGSLALRPADFINVDTFYYHRKTELTEVKDNLSVYGAGLNLKIKDYMDASFYAAFNNGTQKSKLRNRYIIQNFDGYALDGKINIMWEHKFAKTKYSFNVYYGTPANTDSKAFTPISQNTDMGFIVGGTGILNYNDFPGKQNANKPCDIHNLPALMVYSFKINIMPYALKNTYMIAAIYNFTSTNKTFTYRDAGSEADITLGYKNSYMDINLTYGIFISGNGLAAITQSEAPANKTVNKIGLNTSFTFSL